MSKRQARHARPAHADVWVPRVPRWTPYARHIVIAAVIVAAGLGLFAGAGGAADHLDTAGGPPSAGGSQSGAPPMGGFTDGALPTFPSSALPTSGVPTQPGHGIVPPRTSPITVVPSGPAADALAADGVPVVALDAYKKAAVRANAIYPQCGLPWPLLAAIGRVESDHGRFADSQLYADGTSAPAIIGIPLNGDGTALIRDTDHGRLDGDLVYDHAVGPMQFIPSTWQNWRVDGNGDHVVSPFNIYDAAAAAADYLCAAGGDLQTSAGQIEAVLTYNHSDLYLATVLALEKIYAAGVIGVTVPDIGPHPVPGPNQKPTLPPVNPGPPLTVTRPQRSAASTSSAPTRSSTPSPSPSSPAPSSASSLAPSSATSTLPGLPKPTCTTPTSPSAGSLSSTSSSPSPSGSTSTSTSGTPSPSGSTTSATPSPSPSTSSPTSCLTLP